MSRTLNLATVAALALAVGACATPAPNGLTAANNPSLNSVHQPVVQRTDFVLDLQTAGDRVPARELDRLAAWFESIGIGYGDTISVDEARGYGPTGARADVARVAAAHGLLLADGAPITIGEVPPGAIRVVASRSTASVPGCPAWAAATNGVAPQQNTSANFGCAMNSNLAAMIANPEDLVHGRDGSGNGAALTAGRAIRTYREGQPTGRQGLAAPATRAGGN
jgi:pilus assembly protein CpaD